MKCHNGILVYEKGNVPLRQNESHLKHILASLPKRYSGELSNLAGKAFNVDPCSI
ncbi:hypothetical protein C21_04593 [Arenibacter sp. NBRC 103722]|nr:hypothetical protein C21_04593 [Arenibacter sp. NBRC 103722]